VWRRHPREAIDGTLPLKRRELLSRYSISVLPFEDVLGGPHPKRAIQYWAEALNILVEQRFLDAKGEAAPGVAKQALGPDGQALGRQGWQDRWLETPVLLFPGPAMQAAVRTCADARPIPAKARMLSGGSRRRPAQSH
jgi:hypothetical protein